MHTAKGTPNMEQLTEKLKRCIAGNVTLKVGFER